MRADSQAHYDAYLKAGGKIFAIAADDNHCSCRALSPNYAGSYTESAAEDRPSPSGVSDIPAVDCCRAFTMIYAAELSYQAVMNALIDGAFYCSNGPEILAYYIENGRISVDTTPVYAAFLKTTAWGNSASVSDPGGP
jgi:hypothetical protein